MNRYWVATLGALALVSASTVDAQRKTELTSPKVGTTAPSFSLKDTTGATISLESLRGKTVVLEWFNEGCPFVQRHYETQKTTQNLMKENPEVVFLLIDSSNRAENDIAKVEKYRREMGIVAPVLLDTSGDVGRSYGARTTPHVFVINPQGTLVYSGAIDNDEKGTLFQDTAKYTNFVQSTLTAVKGNQKVKQASTNPYGCTVKYASKS